MKPSWYDLDALDREKFGTIVAFLNGRLVSQKAIDWALALTPNDKIEKLAVKSVLNDRIEEQLKEPWLQAWKLIEESWNFSLDGRNQGTAIYHIARRLKSGEQSGALISDLVDIVRPHLKVEPVSRWHPSKKTSRRKPKDFRELIHPSLTSGKLIDLNAAELDQISNVQFLTELLTSLDAAVEHGLSIGRRIGWNEDRSFLYVGMLNRAYYTQTKGRIDGDSEPDAYNTGIAPVTKFLHAVVTRLAELDQKRASAIIEMWRVKSTPVHIRLWAALARNEQLASPEAIGNAFDDMGLKQFWDVDDYSEISELRALRFGELSSDVKGRITKRILAKPPRNFWPKDADKERVQDARLYWAVRELRRIEVAANELPIVGKAFLAENIEKFPKLADMLVSKDFPSGSQAHVVPPNPDNKFDTLSGEARLKLLEVSFSTGRKAWDDNPAGRAVDWLRQDQNALLVLEDFKATALNLNAYPNVWERFGWAHAIDNTRDSASEAESVLALLEKLSPDTSIIAIEGICAWLDRWEKFVAVSDKGLKVWQKFWPIAVEATNLKSDKDDDTNLSVVAWSNDEDREPMDLDTLNTPAGKLVGIFLEFCPNLNENKNAFSDGSPEKVMRDTIISSSGRSNLIARHRMIESLSYFLQADSNWTQAHLISPLLEDNAEALALWRAIARRSHYNKTLKIIGSKMAERVTDFRLARETRRRLVFSLIIETLHSYREQREPAVPIAVIQQM